MPVNPINPDAPRVVLKRLVKSADITQKAVARAVGEREDTFSKILSGADGYELKTPLLVNVLATIGVDFTTYAEMVSTESNQAAGKS